MYVELITVTIILIVIYFCLKNKKESFESKKWYNTSFANYDTNLQFEKNTKSNRLKDLSNTFYTKNKNLNPTAEDENRELNGNKMFYEEKNNDDTRFETEESRDILYKNFTDTETKDYYKKESREGPKISNAVSGSLYFDTENKMPKKEFLYNNKYGNISDMSIEDYTIYQMKKKQDVPFVDRAFFSSEPSTPPDQKSFNDIYYKYDNLVTEEGVMKREDIPVKPNYYTSVPEKDDGKNIFEIKEILFEMPGRRVPINLREVKLVSQGQELDEALSLFGITATFTKGNKYHSDKYKTQNIIDANTDEGNYGYSAGIGENLVQNLILNFSNVNDTFNQYKYNIEAINIYNRKDECCWDRLFKLKVYIVFKNLKTNEEIKHDLKIENHKPSSTVDDRYKYIIKILIPPYNNLKLRSQKYNDLFGELHQEQGTTTTFVVSRGFGHKEGTEYGHEHSNVKEQISPLTDKIVKSCPIPAVQTYKFDPSEKGLDLGLTTKDEEDQRTADYFTEKAGTYHDGTECRLCDYPDGCFSPWAAKQGGDSNRVRLFESQSCRKGKNRECMPCSECATGEEKIVSFCGEGGGKVDTKCAPCTPCPEGYYKAYGCDKPNSAIDNYCVPMTQCKGKPVDESYEDPGKENYYYMKKEGSRGSNSYDSKTDKNGSYDSLYFKKYGNLENSDFYTHLENNQEIIKDAVFKLLSYDEREKLPRIRDKNSIEVNTLNVGDEVTINNQSIKSEDLPYGVIYKVIDEGRNSYSLKVFFNSNEDGKKNNNWASIYKTTKRQKNREGKNISNPYYGQDRECAKCDVCPEGFELLPGTCTDKNSLVNSICQRKINIDNILQKDLSGKCPPGKIYNKDRVKSYLNSLNSQQAIQDNRKRIAKYPILRDYLRKRKNFKDLRSGGSLSSADLEKISKIDFKDINNPDNYPWITDLENKLSEKTLLSKGCVSCRTCPRGYFVDPINPGCKNGENTNCIRHKQCKTDGSERLIVEGTSTTDNVCGPCKCPDGDVGNNPFCDGSYTVRGCEPNIKCNTTSNYDDEYGEYYYDKPGDYGNTTKKNKCLKCDKECPVGTFKIGGCDENGNGNIICKNHRECDKETMLVVEPGTTTKDTICKCIDGYDWPQMFEKDGKSFGGKNVDANKCVEIKGQCHKNPCHPNANCYDNFNNVSGAYESTVCQCDLSEGWIETETLGFGENGCKKFPNKHFHNVRESEDRWAPGYEDLSSNVKNIFKHLGEDYHKKQTGKHLHKNYVPHTK